MCIESPVAQRARADCIAAFNGKVWDLGIVRDPARCAQQRSAHCCGDRAENPAARNSQYVLAWDAGHAVGDTATALAVRQAFLADDRVDYVIDRGVLYHRDGRVSDNTGHEDHDHITFRPGTELDDRPFIFTGDDDMLSDDAQKFIRTELANQDDRIVARVKKELSDSFGNRTVKKLNRLLDHFGLKVTEGD